jgi:hypothetical protein
MSSSLYVKVWSGLCNQLFQIAAGYAYAKRHGLTLIVPERTLNGKPTYYKQFLTAFIPFLGPQPPDSLNSWSEPRFSYTPIPASMNEIGGYFQSEKYFRDVSGEIRTLFVPPAAVRDAVEAKHASLLAIRGSVVAVHVRRTDYCMLKKHNILTMEYYKKALRLVEGKQPIVFSDDLAWCRTQPVFEGAIFVEEPNDVAALYLMSQFSHIVIANSTFSWWAAYLGPQPKTVIAPSRWFGPGGPPDIQDIYMDHWTLVDV